MKRKKVESGKVQTIILVPMLILIFTACQEEPELRSEVFQVPATATFLRSDGSDSPSDPLIIELKPMGVVLPVPIYECGPWVNSSIVHRVQGETMLSGFFPVPCNY